VHADDWLAERARRPAVSSGLVMVSVPRPAAPGALGAVPWACTPGGTHDASQPVMTTMLRRIRAASSFLVPLGALLCACGGGESAAPPFASLGELRDAIDTALRSPDEAVRRDSDSDGLPDSIEARLGTNPDDRDSDHDGLVDSAELFGSGAYDRSARLPDLDGDGAIAAIDADDDGDGANDGIATDSDGDGIPNYLEYYGYTYDWMTGTFQLWDGNPDTPHYRTDPLQISTDQDSYSDSVEVSRVGLDVTVASPGDHPLVPAVPNIEVELIGYSVTLDQSITYEEGHTLAIGQTWERTTEQSHSYTDERSWEAGIEAGYASSSGHILVHANYGETYSSTQTTSTAIASGGSILNDQQWSVARTSNPTRAAQIKLYVKVHNLGGAPLSAIIPTLTLKIGGLDVATFQPGGSQINLLVPGDTYPRDPSVTWVIDSIDTGGGTEALSLTMRELRAIENGAPVSLAVTQLRGDVMRLNAESVWERVGDVNEYLGRCDAVSANIRFDLGDGTFVHHLVYAGEGATGVPVTLHDALALLGVGDDAVLHVPARDGSSRAISLDGYSFVFDAETLRRNGWRMGDGTTPSAPPAGFVLGDLRLYPSTSLLVRAPREAAGQLGPVIHFAYVDPDQGEVKVCATDYQGITSAIVRSADGEHSLALTEDIPGAGYFSALATSQTFQAGEDYEVVVTNRAGQTAERSLGRLYVPPGPRLPLIRTVTLDLASHQIYANVESGAPDDPKSELQWVRAYHPGLPGGFVALDSVPNAFEDPSGYVATLPAAFASTNLELVAYVAPGVYARHRIGENEIVTPRVAGTVFLPGFIDTTGEDEEWNVPRFDLDEGTYEMSSFEADDWNPAWEPQAPFDLWVNVDEGHTGHLHFNAAYARVPAGYDFATLTRAEIEGFAPGQTATLALLDPAGLQQGDILALLTTSGRYAKARVVTIASDDDGWTNAYSRTLVLEYVTYDQ
jgi:hypothetical protein